MKTENSNTQKKPSKVKSFFKRIGARNLVVICAVLLIGGAVGKLGTTFVLGCGALANEWTLFSLSMSKFQFLFIFFTGMSAFLLLFLPLVPSIIPKHKDYYCP